jgi:hypothetical protein
MKKKEKIRKELKQKKEKKNVHRFFLASFKS